LKFQKKKRYNHLLSFFLSVMGHFANLFESMGPGSAEPGVSLRIILAPQRNPATLDIQTPARQQLRELIREVGTETGTNPVIIEPMALLLERNMSGLPMSAAATGSIEQKDEPAFDTLAHMQKDLAEADGPAVRVIRGQALGDRALHMRAGFGAGHLKRVMKTEAARQYTEEMAINGYYDALTAAEKASGQIRKAIEEAIGPLLRFLQPAITIMTGIQKRATGNKDVEALIKGLGESS
jgi:hypothetical protein